LLSQQPSRVTALGRSFNSIDRLTCDEVNSVSPHEIRADHQRNAMSLHTHSEQLNFELVGRPVDESAWCLIGERRSFPADLTASEVVNA